MGIIKKINNFGYHTGYADHSLTEDKIITYLLTSKAIDYGQLYRKACYIGQKKKKPDYISSFEINDFDEYVKYFKKDHIIKFKETTSFMEKNIVMLWKVCSVQK